MPHPRPACWAIACSILAALAVIVGSASAAGAQAGEAVRGRLVDAAGKPVPGVVVIVERAGTEIGQGSSDDNGQWEVALPEAGEYSVRLDTSSLPEGTGLREGGKESREVTVSPGTQRSILFPLGKVEAGGSGLASVLAQRSIDGLQLGALIGITAIGLSLIFGTTGLINFAHGELVTAGAVIAYMLNTAGGSGMHVVLAALLAIPIVAALAGGSELLLWRPMRHRRVGLVSMFIATIGLALILRQLILLVYGGDPHPYAQYGLQRAWRWGPLSVTPRDVAILGVSLLVLTLIGVLLTRSRLGTAIRSVADNRDLAGCSGINVDHVVLMVWVIGGGLAALGGILYGLNQTVTWNMGVNLLLLMFSGVILGGLGTAFGAFLGSMFVGLLAQLSTAFFDSELQTVWALVLLILALLVRPQGLLGQRERVG